jgi:hypothetical protein
MLFPDKCPHQPNARVLIIKQLKMKPGQALGCLLGAVEGRPETPAAPARVEIPPRPLCKPRK